MNNTVTPHRLNGAFQRVRRAEEQLVDLEQQINSLGLENTNAFTIHFDSDIAKLRPKLTTLGVPMSLGIRIGEICYNLRSSLDYLVFELVRLNLGSAPSHITQFPIESDPDVFKGRRKTWIKGVNDTHVALIERYQPYKGCDWSAALRDFSNRDKHREFVSIQGEFVAHAYSRLTDSNFDEIRAPVFRRPHPVRGEVDVKVHVRLTICFEDRTPIMATLNKIKDGVADTLSTFKASF